MSTFDLILIAGVALFVGCYVYIYFGTKRLVRMRNARLDARDLAASGEPAAPEVVPQGAVAEPVAKAPSPFQAAAEGPADDLMKIKGIGPKLSARLAELGVFQYAQIAEWTPAQLAAVDAQLGSFQGRPARDQWQSQARLLASGDLKGYERAHGKLGPVLPPAGG
jgi:predicted flap endonuclease-1-like 5' DNA nuclease